MAKPPPPSSPFDTLADLKKALRREEKRKKEQALTQKAEVQRAEAQRSGAHKQTSARKGDANFAGIEAELLRHAQEQLGTGNESKKHPIARQAPIRPPNQRLGPRLEPGTKPARPQQRTPAPGNGLASGKLDPPSRSSRQTVGHVEAILGPTNTGKTYMAIERMVTHHSGIIGLPLRLLAREVYAKIVVRVGQEKVALHTGEERIIPEGARYHVCTVEAMPPDVTADFVAIDEVQLAADFARGHVFTDRLLHLRGRKETMLLGAATMKPMIELLLPDATITSRPRMSQLTYEGARKVSRLPRRSAVVTFSVNDVYAIAELVRRQKGGAAVVMGSLSPRTRNAQVDLFQNGDVDHLIATDAIGMGLNLDLDHVAFAAEKKFDGFQHRRLTAPELAQIAGRAGRHTRDGTFGATGRVSPFEDELVEQLECHIFQPLKLLQWRSRALDFTSYADLIATLETSPNRPGLTKALPASDVQALEILHRDRDIQARAASEASLKLLWEVCQIPDYRKIAPANHAELISLLFQQLHDRDTLSRDWLAAQIAFADRIDGDIDTLANRIAHIRTWTFVANKKGWLDDPLLWQEKTRAIEDRLSDALHERLTKRFIDRRTSVLMKRLREKTMLEAEITAAGDVLVEGQHVGQLQGFRFAPDVSAEGNDAKAIHAAAQKVLSVEFENRSEKIAGAANDQFVLSGDGLLRWQGAPIAKLIASDEILRPRLMVLADEGLSGEALENVQNRINLWLSNHVNQLLQPLMDLSGAEGLEGLAKGLAFQLVENLGILDRRTVADDVRALDQDARASLRKFGVRFGAYHIYIPALLKPAPSTLLVMMWALNDGGLDQNGIQEVPALSASGRTSIPVDEAISPQLYKTVGFGVYGKRAVRIDILERLADLIRPLLSWRPTEEAPEPPEGVLDRGFTVTVAMTSLLGCAGEDFSTILKSLGYRVERRKIEAPDLPLTSEAKEDPAADAAPEATASDKENTETEEASSAAPETGAEADTGAEAADVIPAEDSAPAVTGSEDDMSNESTAEDQPKAEQDAVAPSETEAPTDPDAAATDAKSTEETEEEEHWIEIWRPGGRGDRKPHRGGHRHKQGGKDGAKPGKGGKRGGPRNEGGRKGGDRPRHSEGGRGKPAHKPSRKPEKVADPDSPFAALAALKADLDKGK